MAASAVLLQPALAQRGGASAPPGGGAAPGGTAGPPGTPPGTGGNTGRSPGTTPNSTQNAPQTQTNTIYQPIFVSGRVTLEDGTAPPDRVAIQRVCGAVPRIEGYTDSKGYFSIQLGATLAEPLQDASVGGLDPTDPFSNTVSTPNSAAANRGLTERQLMGCELRAQLAGYQSQSVSLSGRRSMDSPEIGVILLHRLGGSEGTTISATTLRAPKDAKKAYEKGLALAKKNKLEEAQTELEKAVASYPQYALAWFDLGRVQVARGHQEDARKSFEQSIRADQKYVAPYVEISRLDLQARQWQQLADTSGKAVKLDPFNYPDAFFWNAVANYNLHNLDTAEESARRAQQLDTRHQMPQVSHLMGVILAERKDFPAAAEQMRNYLKFAPQAQDAQAVRAQLSELEKLAKPAAPEAAQQ